MSRTIEKNGFDSFDRSANIYNDTVIKGFNWMDDGVCATTMPSAQATSSNSYGTYDTVASVSVVNDIGDQLRNMAAAIEDLKKEKVIVDRMALELSGIRRSELKTLNRGRNI